MMVGDDGYKRLCQFLDALVQSPWGFEVGFECLKQRLGAAGRKSEGLFKSTLKTWIGRLKGSIGYKTLSRIGAWLQLAAETDVKWLEFVLAELVKELKPFCLVFLPIAGLFYKNKEKEAVAATVKTIAGSIKVLCHRKAIEALGSCQQPEKLVTLAAFEADCDKAAELAADL
jgi:hypothetical protein